MTIKKLENITLQKMNLMVIDDENKIKNLIDEIIKCEDDYNQAEYIVEDYMKSQLAIQ